MIKTLKDEMKKLVELKMITSLKPIHYVASIINPSTRSKTYSWDKSGINRMNAINTIKKKYKII